MRNLKMSMPNIRSKIFLKTDYWINKSATNCYAFALGLDIPEPCIMTNAYQLGTFCSEMSGINYNSLTGCLNWDTILKLDLRTLNILFKEVEPNSEYEPGDCWQIALFENYDLNDFHFLRRGDNGIWYHKRGYDNDIECTDSMGKTITDPKKCFITDYEYIKTYQLKLNKDTNDN